MVTRIYIDNFKTLVDFEIHLVSFNCLIGLNGAGKSTFLQAVDFLNAIAGGWSKEWCHWREWEHHELRFAKSQKKTITFEVDIDLDCGKYTWSGSYNTNKSYMYCTEELIFERENGEKLLSLDGTNFRFKTLHGEMDGSKILQKYDGSILQTIKDELMCEELKSIKNFLSAIISLELLNPVWMRKASQGDVEYIGDGGENLASYMNQFMDERRERFIRDFKNFDSNFDTYSITKSKWAWRKLSIKENYSDESGKPYIIETSARHISDGLLRIMAILAQNESHVSMLLFDEIENGINPEFMDKLVELLVGSDNQVLVTSHSPVFINYLEDETALKGVQLIYKNAHGYSRAKRFFDIPQIRERFDILGAGESMLDVSLSELTKRLACES